MAMINTMRNIEFICSQNKPTRKISVYSLKFPLMLRIARCSRTSKIQNKTWPVLHKFEFRFQFSLFIKSLTRHPCAFSLPRVSSHLLSVLTTPFVLWSLCFVASFSVIFQEDKEDIPRDKENIPHLYFKWKCWL